MKGFPKDKVVPYIWEGIAGQTGKKVKPFDLVARRTIDREAADKSVNFIRKNAEKKKPFFLYTKKPTEISGFIREGRSF